MVEEVRREDSFGEFELVHPMRFEFFDFCEIVEISPALRLEGQSVLSVLVLFELQGEEGGLQTIQSEIEAHVFCEGRALLLVDGLGVALLDFLPHFLLVLASIQEFPDFTQSLGQTVLQDDPCTGVHESEQGLSAVVMFIILFIVPGQLLGVEYLELDLHLRETFSVEAVDAPVLQGIAPNFGHFATHFPLELDFLLSHGFIPQKACELNLLFFV